MNDKYDFYYRLDLSYYELEDLQRFLKTVEPKEADALIFEDLIQKINAPKKIAKSVKKKIATDQATQARTKRAKEKIQNAINLMRLEGIEPTAYQIAKRAGVSYNTAQKYFKK